MPYIPNISQILPASGIIDGNITDVSKAVTSSFKLENGTLTGNVGDELTLEFDGTAIGVLWSKGIDTGAVDIKIDGKEYGTLFAFDDFGVRSEIPYYAIFDDGLKPGKHILKVKVSDKKAAMSLGNKIKIDGFLVGRSAQ